MIRCNTCHEEKPDSDFYKDARIKGGYWKRCRACHVKAKKNWVSRQGDTHKKYQRSYKLLYQWGLTEESHAAMLASQDDRCAICKVRQDRPLGVDHDHTCCPADRSCGSCIRGLLCDSCNKGLGFFGNNPDLLQSAIDYLEAYLLRRVLAEAISSPKRLKGYDIQQLVEKTLTRSLHE